MSKMGLHDPFGHLKHKLWPKGGWESNWQFDSWPLKVRNRHDFLMCRWCATYRWKALDKGYNFSLNLISIRGLHAKLWARKIAWVLTVRILKLPFGSPGTKCHLDGASWTSIEYSIRGKVVASPSSGYGESCQICECEFAHGLS
jgi:hypothetical protein